MRGSVVDMRLSALDYREAARLWGIEDPAIALRVHAALGGIPGYRSLIATAPATLPDFDKWIIENLLAVDVGVFTRTEVDYLLREDPRITARALYYDILSAVAMGASTPATIGAAIGRDDNAVRHPLRVLESTGHLVKTRDVPHARKPVITVSDPVIRFDRLITAPSLGQLELGRAEQERDRKTKPQRYAEAGIAHFWHVEDADGKPVAYVDEFDPATGAYALTGIHHGRLKVAVPFPIDIDLDDLPR
jgi:uncharacterized protein